MSEIRYRKKIDDTVQIRMPAGQQEKLVEYAHFYGMTLNGFILEAIQEKIEGDAIKKDRPARIINMFSAPDEAGAEASLKNRQMWLDEFYQLVDASMDEGLELNDFPRAHFGRELIEFSDEG